VAVAAEPNKPLVSFSFPLRIAIYLAVIVCSLYGLFHLAEWNYYQYRKKYRVPQVCQQELQRIDEAKRLWGLDHGSTNDTPAWSDLYEHGNPRCQGDGQYILGKLSEPARCTEHGMSSQAANNSQPYHAVTKNK
jgi:hypothetical protein